MRLFFSFLIVVVIVLGALAFIISRPTKTKELLKTYKRKEGAVKALAEEYSKGELSSKEIMKTMKDRGIIVDATSTTFPSMVINISGFIGFLLCILTSIYIHTNGQPFLSLQSSSRDTLMPFLSLLQPMDIPLIAIVIAIIAVIAATPLLILSSKLRVKKGGCANEDTTVVLIKEGPYGIIRHPTHLAVLVWIIGGLIATSPWLHFTHLSLVGMLIIISAFYLMEINEEKFDQMKWGDEYRQYMKEIPRWNIIKGLRARKRETAQRRESVEE